MNKKVTALVLGLAFCGNLMASDPELVVSCSYVKKQGILHIEARNVAGLGEVSVTYENGSQADVTLSGPIDAGLECSIPLPSQGSLRQRLELRHTGWALTSIQNGYVGHDSIDCED